MIQGDWGVQSSEPFTGPMDRDVCVQRRGAEGGKGDHMGGCGVNKAQAFPLEGEQTLAQWDPFGVPEGSPNFYTRGGKSNRAIKHDEPAGEKGPSSSQPAASQLHSNKTLFLSSRPWPLKHLAIHTFFSDIMLF